MGKLRSEVRSLIQNMRGLKPAQEEARDWYLNTLKSTGDTSVRRTGEPFIPGKIYVFRYETPVTEDKLPWWDKNPVVLSLGRKDGKDIGINLNLLPHTVRLNILDRIHEQYEPLIDDTLNRNVINVSDQPGIISLNYNNAKRFLSRMGFTYAIRTYITTLRKNTGIVSYNEWRRVVLLDFIDVAKGSRGQARGGFSKHVKKKGLS